MHTAARVCAVVLCWMAAAHVSTPGAAAASRSRVWRPSDGGRVLRGKWVQVVVGPQVFDVTAFGAKGDGKNNDTSAIQAAFHAAKQAGGGTVLLPAKRTSSLVSHSGGLTFLSSAIHFESSNTALEVQSGATLLVSNDRKKWPAPLDFITGSGFNDIALVGAGKVDGQGEVWWANRNDFRPRMAYLKDINNFLVANLTFVNSPNHNLELYTDTAEMTGVTILAPPSTNTPVESHNTDAVDVHGSPFWIHDCHFSVGDDNIAAHVNDTLVEDCTFGTGHGASIGSLQDNYLKNITFRRITFNGTTQACRIKVRPDSKGFLRDVVYSDLKISNVQTGLIITMDYSATDSVGHPLSSGGLRISNVTFSNIQGTHVQQAGSIDCDKDAPCEQLTFDNVNWGDQAAGYQCSNAYGTSKGCSPSVCVKSH